MWSYFRGWKRKIGAVMLLLACMFAAGWGRSLNRADKLEIRNLKLLSVAGGLIWRSSGRGVSLRGFPDDSAGGSVSFASSDYFDPYSNDEHWMWRRLGFGESIYQVNAVLTSSDNMRAAPTRFYRVPYWSIVLPPTLISAWCLLMKPQTKPATKLESSNE
jgi:hypothetical protein